MPLTAKTMPETGGKLPLPTLLMAGRAVLFSRFLLLAGGVGNSLLLPLALDQRGVGLFFISQIYVAAVTITALLGLTLTMPAKLTAAVAMRDFAAARQMAIAGFCLAGAASLVLAALTAGAGTLLVSAANPAERPELSSMVWIVSATIPPAAVAVLMAETLRSFHLYRWASNLSVLGGVAPVAYLLLCAGMGWQATLPQVLVAALAGSVLGAGLGLFRLARHIWCWKAASGRTHWPDLVQATLPNLASTLTLFVLSQADFLLLSIWMGPEAVAHYGVALRLSSLLILPLSIANSAFVPIAVELHTTDQHARLQKTTRQIAMSAFGLAALGYAAFAFSGPWLIALWNPSYGEVYWLFLLLGAGQVLHAWFGAAGTLLMILGHQVEAMWLAIILGATATILCVVGLSAGGILGLALASGIGNAAQASVFWWREKRRLGIDTALGFGRT